MFFIGATGQLLTLILTVFIPLMLMASGQHKTLLKSSPEKTEIQFSQKIHLNDKLQNELHQNALYAEYLKYPISNLKEIKQDFHVIFRKTFYRILLINNSGNKAPPTCCQFFKL